MSEILKIITQLYAEKVIYVRKHRKSDRTGLSIPIYSLSSYESKIKNKAKNKNKLDIDSLLAGVISERLVEYPFLQRNLISTTTKARILDVGSAEPRMAVSIGKHDISNSDIACIDINQIAPENTEFSAFLRMDSRNLGFRDELFDQIICISTIEHIGIPSAISEIFEADGDIKTISEFYRVLKKGRTVILTLPYSDIKEQKKEYRIYDRISLDNLISIFSIIKKEFYLYNGGKWSKCDNQSIIDIGSDESYVPPYLHSNVCACLLLKKE
jgi:ubiquinone/menaquinone biosynthesis C-methylase UbiE